MSATTQDSDRRLPRLSTLYLALAAIMAGVFVMGAFTASHVTRQAVWVSTKAVDLSDRARTAMHDIRDALWVADNTLGAMLIAPEPEHGPTITRHLGLARERLHFMIDDPAFDTLDISEDLLALRHSLDTLHMHVHEFMDKRAYPNRVYPLPPYLTSELLTPNVDFETATDIALRDIAEADGQPYASTLVEYINTHIRPVQARIFTALSSIESTLLDWSTGNTTTVQRVANRNTYLLWAITAFGLLFMLITYVVIRRSVLDPLRHIARTLAQYDDRRLPERAPGRSQEIQQLVQAFNGMQRQIHQRQQALEHQAMHDALSGLPNRVLFSDRLQHAIKHKERSGGSLAVLLLDLDRFKEVNDALGHPVGDRLLQQVARRLRESMRSCDTVARLGGDEFAILAEDMDEVGAEEFATKIRQTISGVFTIEHQNVYVGTSIGIALYPDHGADTSTLLRRADIALYVGKRQSGGIGVYRPDADEHRADRLSLVGDLHEELRHPRHLAIHYQPMIRLPQGSPAGVEALLRWHHPVHGWVAPDQIIRMAEHTGLIGPLTYWVLETALTEFSRIQKIHTGMSLSVNLSAWNLQDPDLPHAVSTALEKTQLPADLLTLEITESAMMSDPVHAREILELLNVMGVRLAVDDFGTGFSSLGYLKLLPVSSLKIDRSFVMEMLDDENDAIIVRSTIDLAHNLGFDVVAEGVENGETLALLGALGCNYAQGYFVCHPGPAERVAAWLGRYLESNWKERLVAPGLRVLTDI